MIQGLTPSGDPKPDGKQYYEPVVLTVSGYSQYNENEISFTEIDGFWSLPNDFMKVGTNDRRPPQGAVARFNLSSKPKRSPSAKPGSLYRDITGIYKTAEGEQPIARQSAPPPPAGDPREQWSDAPSTAPSTPVLDTDAKIKKSQALNLLQEILNSGDTENAPKMIEKMGFETTDDAIDVFAFNWNMLRNGETPFTIGESEWENPAAEVDEQAQAHLADVANEQPASEQPASEQPANDDGYGEPESIPW